MSFKSTDRMALRGVGTPFRHACFSLAGFLLLGSMHCAAASTGFTPGADMQVESVAVQADGKILVGGAYGLLDGTAHTGIGRLNGDGSLDTSFVGSADFDVFSINVQSDGKILIGGFFANVDGQAHRALMRLNADGSLDSDFLKGHTGPYDSVLAQVNSIVVQSDGKILVGGQFSKINGTARDGIARLNSDGSLDTTFAASTLSYVNANGVSLAASVQAIALQSDGKVVISGSFSSVNSVARSYLARLNNDGSLDTSFSAGANALDNFAYAIALQTDGKIVLGGSFTAVNGANHPFVARLNTDGSTDGSFAAGADDTPGLVYSVALQADGKILLGGIDTSAGHGVGNGLVRLLPNGSLDGSFTGAALSGVSLDFIYAIALQSNGKIVGVGDFTSVDNVAHSRIARFNSDGSLDQSAGGGSTASFNPNQRGLTGTWYNPATSGQGIVMQVAPDLIASGEGLLFGGWFTYDSAPAGGPEKQRWYTLQGPVNSGSASSTLTIYTVTGGNFNAGPKVSGSSVGNATLTFSDCSHASLVYNFTDGSTRSGTIPLNRLDSDPSCSAGGDNGVNVGDGLLSGTWYDPTTSGQGLVFDISPSQNALFAGWYTFAPNGSSAESAASQRWYTLQTALNATSTSAGLTLNNVGIFTATGGIFDNPAKPSTTQVGSASVAFSSCSALTLSYSFNGGSNQALSGKIDLVRLGPTPQGCKL